MHRNTVRVATLQYLIRPVADVAAFSAQVTGLVETAADYGVQLLVFPEYFTLQLLTLGDVQRPMSEQVRALAGRTPLVRELLRGLAQKHGLYIVGGTMLVEEPTTQHLQNTSYLFAPDGSAASQPKLHLTRFEREEWSLEGSDTLTTFDTELGRVGIAICYDVEFPDVAREHARQGTQILVVPSCTDDRQAYLRVRLCAHARAIENQLYVVVASTVGSLPQVPAVALNYGQAAILTPSDFRFSRDGIAAEGIPNQEAMVIADVDLDALAEARGNGTVLPLIDSERRRGRPFAAGVEHVGRAPDDEVTIRHTRPTDFDAIIELCERVYPGSPPWSRAQLASHLDVFPEGQLVAVLRSGSVVGMAASLIVWWDDYDSDTSWRDFTAGGTFTNHDPEKGRTLYGAEIMVDPGFQGRGLGKQLYLARLDLAVRLRLLRIRAGARLRGYSAHAERLSAEAYVSKVTQGELVDPTLTFQLRRGFRVLRVVPGYLKHDPESLGYAALIEWLNPAIATPADYAAQPERFRPGRPPAAT